MTTAQIVLVVLLVLVALAVAGGLALRSRRSAQLKSRFGPEYDRAVESSGGRRPAEKRLSEVAQRHDRLELRELSPEARVAYVQRWTAVQEGFVDDPYDSVDRADALVSEVMRERGYPVEDFEERAQLVAVDHPGVVEHYRAAHSVHHGDLRQASTEDLRAAFVHYRALFEELTGVSSARGGQYEREAEHREH